MRRGASGRCSRLAWVLPLLQACARPPASALDYSTPLGTPTDKGDIATVPVKGHRVVIIYGLGECTVEGELIAVTPQSLVILVSDDALLEVPRTELVELELELYPSSSSSIYTTTTIGSFSTVSHGFWLVISLPTWLGVGLPLAAAESRASRLVLNYRDVPPLAQYARFPHGGFMNWEGRTKSAPTCE